MERFRRWPCQPASPPASQLAKTEEESLPTAVGARSERKAGLRSSLVVRPQLCRKSEGDRGACMKKVRGTERKGGKKEREGVS